jgi:hypothetical protein
VEITNGVCLHCLLYTTALRSQYECQILTQPAGVSTLWPVSMCLPPCIMHFDTSNLLPALKHNLQASIKMPRHVDAVCDTNGELVEEIVQVAVLFAAFDSVQGQRTSSQVHAAIVHNAGVFLSFKPPARHYTAHMRTIAILRLLNVLYLSFSSLASAIFTNCFPDILDSQC